MPELAMNERRFAWTLRARGADLATWSPRDRDAATQLLRESPLARQQLADALAAEDAPAADCLVLARMQAVIRNALAPATPAMRRMRWGALAAAAAAGLYIGGLAAEPDRTADLDATLEATFPATVLAALDQ